MLDKNTTFVAKSRFQYLLTFTYLAGWTAHFIRLITGRTPSELIPKWFDVIIFILALYGAAVLTVVFLSNNIQFTSKTNKIVYGIMYGHLLTTIPIHIKILITQDSSTLDNFGAWYSMIVMVWFSCYAYLSATTLRRIVNTID